VDRILVIKEGEIAEAGTHSELNALGDGIYSNLLKMQLEVTE
jgi:ABC-type multidrug transport system fused ATPase/permease subunit